MKRLLKMKGLSAVVARDVDGAIVLNEAMNEVCSIGEDLSLVGGVESSARVDTTW